MQLELCDEDIRLAIAEYLTKRFPNYQIDCAETSWRATRTRGANVEAVSMQVELEEK